MGTVTVFAAAVNCKYCGKTWTIDSKGKSSEYHDHVDKCTKNPYRIKLLQELLKKFLLPFLRHAHFYEMVEEINRCKDDMESLRICPDCYRYGHFLATERQCDSCGGKMMESGHAIKEIEGRDISLRRLNMRY